VADTTVPFKQASFWAGAAKLGFVGATAAGAPLPPFFPQESKLKQRIHVAKKVLIF
jgi:hypothetical protein